MKLRFLLFVLLFSFTRTLYAQDLRGDTIDLHSYLITLDMSNYASGSLTGDARIGVIAKMNNVQGIHLDLIQLHLDSVKVNAVNSGYTYNDTLLNIDFQTTLNQGDSATVEVYYHGRPLQIAGDFGGFYWLSSAAYNIGVSFKSDPNNFGKCWFPCFDNFQVRSNYEYYVSTPNTDKAFCNGLLLDSTVNQFKTTWHWKLKESIPSYLASTTVSHFLTITDTVNGINGTIPIEIGVTPADTAQLRKQFIHLHQAFHNLEAHWGPYPWERIGYTIVPFNAGAMEHATNITFSSYFLDPAVPSFYNQGEQKMAHELSHHWFGDLVTTDGSPDMWLNEGWAVFNEYLFFEGVYSPDSAKLQWRLNHQWVQWMAAIADSAYLPVSGVPHSKTYGTTVYQKGGDMVHTLRGYMGDSLFFSCIRGYLNYYRYNNGGTQLLSNYLSQCSGMDLSDFFNDWILAPGFPHFSIQNSSVTESDGNYNVNINIRQRLSHAPQYYTNVPLQISYFNTDFSRVVQTVMVNGQCTSYSTNLPYNPAYIAVDFDEKLQDAISDEWKTLSDTGSYTFNIGMMIIHVNALQDSVLMRIEHNWIPADAMYHPIQGLHLSNQRYWRVDGIFDSTFKADAIINYGTGPAGVLPVFNGYTASVLDTSLISNSEDSLVMMYRPNQDSDWSIVDSFALNPGLSLTDKMGQITIYNLQKGEYALAIYNSNLPTAINTDTAIVCEQGAAITQVSKQPKFRVFPNPATGTVVVSFENNVFGKLQIFDLLGRIMLEREIPAVENSMEIGISNFAAGTYLVTMTDNSGNRITQKLVKE